MTSAIGVYIRLIVSGVGGFLAWFLGGWDSLLYLLITFTVVDYVTGVLRGIMFKCLSSKIGYKGLIRKVMIFVVVGLASLTDSYLLGGVEVLRSIVICFYIANEGISMLENASAIGLPIPRKLKEALVQLRDTENTKEAPPSKKKDSGYSDKNKNSKE